MLIFHCLEISTCVRVKGLLALLPSTTTTTTPAWKRSRMHTGGGVYSVVRKAVTNVLEGLVYL